MVSYSHATLPPVLRQSIAAFNPNLLSDIDRQSKGALNETGAQEVISGERFTPPNQASASRATTPREQLKGMMATPR